MPSAYSPLHRSNSGMRVMLNSKSLAAAVVIDTAASARSTWLPEARLNTTTCWRDFGDALQHKQQQHDRHNVSNMCFSDLRELGYDVQERVRVHGYEDSANGEEHTDDLRHLKAICVSDTDQPHGGYSNQDKEGAVKRTASAPQVVGAKSPRKFVSVCSDYVHGTSRQAQQAVLSLAECNDAGRLAACEGMTEVVRKASWSDSKRHTASSCDDDFAKSNGDGFDVHYGKNAWEHDMCSKRKVSETSTPMRMAFPAPYSKQTSHGRRALHTEQSLQSSDVGRDAQCTLKRANLAGIQKGAAAAALQLPTALATSPTAGKRKR
jgi:hypothetical protein